MRKHVGTVVCMLLALALVAAGCGKSEAPKPAAPPAPAGPDGRVLFEQKCSVCHGIDRATARTESKDKWIEIVKQMQGKKADWISDAEAAKIAEFLATEHGKK